MSDKTKIELKHIDWQKVRMLSITGRTIHPPRTKARSFLNSPATPRRDPHLTNGSFKTVALGTLQMAPDSADHDKAAKLIGKCFSDAELKFLWTKPEFLHALESLKSLDDAVRVAEFGVHLIMKENGVEGPTRFR